MRRFIIFLTLLTLQTARITFAQTNDYSVLVCDNKEVREFLINVGELRKDDSGGSCYAVDLSEMTFVETVDKCGIYNIGVFSDHTFSHVLLSDKGKKEFLDCYANLSQTLNSLFSFFDNCSCCFTDFEKLSYIKAVLDIYKENEVAVPW